MTRAASLAHESGLASCDLELQFCDEPWLNDTAHASLLLVPLLARCWTARGSPFCAEALDLPVIGRRHQHNPVDGGLLPRRCRLIVDAPGLQVVNGVFSIGLSAASLLISFWERKRTWPCQFGLPASVEKRRGSAAHTFAVVV